MGKVFDGIDDHLRGWIASQSLFFVGTAPLAAQGHVNVSPKRPVDTLAVLDPVNVAYLDLSAAAPRRSPIWVRTAGS